MNTRGNAAGTVVATSQASLDTMCRLCNVRKFRQDQLSMLRSCGLEGQDLFAQLRCGAGKTIGFVSCLYPESNNKAEA